MKFDLNELKIHEIELCEKETYLQSDDDKTCKWDLREMLELCLFILKYIAGSRPEEEQLLFQKRYEINF